MIEFLINEIIELAKDNTAGTLLNKIVIGMVVENIIKSKKLDKNYIDMLIDNHESESGYIVKASDFLLVLNPYLLDKNIDYEEKTPKISDEDKELIELLYGDFHAECGDR